MPPGDPLDGLVEEICGRIARVERIWAEQNGHKVPPGEGEVGEFVSKLEFTQVGPGGP